MEKFVVYILYSESYHKTYVGYTNDLERRIWEHNHQPKKSFTSRFKPWIIIYSENFSTKKEAMEKEKWFKTTSGRRLKKQLLEQFLSSR